MYMYMYIVNVQCVVLYAVQYRVGPAAARQDFQEHAQSLTFACGLTLYKSTVLSKQLPRTENGSRSTLYMYSIMMSTCSLLQQPMV